MRVYFAVGVDFVPNRATDLQSDLRELAVFIRAALHNYSGTDNGIPGTLDRATVNLIVGDAP